MTSHGIGLRKDQPVRPTSSECAELSDFPIRSASAVVQDGMVFTQVH